MEGLNKGSGAKGSFQKAISSMILIKELQKEFGRINLGVQMTFTSQNQHKIIDSIKGIYELTKPDNITIALVRGDPKEKVNLNLDIKLYHQHQELHLHQINHLLKNKN